MKCIVFFKLFKISNTFKNIDAILQSCFLKNSKRTNLQETLKNK